MKSAAAAIYQFQDFIRLRRNTKNIKKMFNAYRADLQYIRTWISA